MSACLSRCFLCFPLFFFFLAQKPRSFVSHQSTRILFSFLAVQDSSIADIVTHSLIDASFDFSVSRTLQQQ